MDSNYNSKINFTETEIIEIYNTIPHVLSRKVTKLGIIDSKQPVICLEKVSNSSYWLINTEEEWCLLLPKGKLKVNPAQYLSFQLIFDCEGYLPEDTKDFTLIKPAKVSKIPNATQWKLEEKGELQFGTSSPFSQLRSEIQELQEKLEQFPIQLKQAEDKYQQLQTQFNQLQEHSQQIETLLSESSKRENILLEQLVTKGYFQQEIKQLTQLIQGLPVTNTAIISEKTFPTNTIDAEFVSPSKLPNIDIEVETKLINVYHQLDSETFLKSFKIYQVSESIDDFEERLKNPQAPITFELATNIYHANYWIIGTNNDWHYMFPKKDLKVIKHNKDSIAQIFNLENYLPELSSEFQLIKPAIVININPENKWQLFQKGIMKFI